MGFGKSDGQIANSEDSTQMGTQMGFRWLKLK